MSKIRAFGRLLIANLKVAIFIVKNNGMVILKRTPKTWWVAFSGLAAVKEFVDSMGYFSYVHIPFWSLLLFAVICFTGAYIYELVQCAKETYKLVSPDEDPYENLEVRQVSSYLDNAFEFYPDSVMCFGVNSAFIFKYAGPKSLVNHFFLNFCSGEDPKVIKELVYQPKYPGLSDEELTRMVEEDLAKREADGHITREEIQRRIDAELEKPEYEELRQRARETTYKDDTHRLDEIRLRDASQKELSVEDKSHDEVRKQYPIGTVLMIDLGKSGNDGRKLTLITNSLVNTKESLKVDVSADPTEANVAYTDFLVHYDPDHPVGDSYCEIWNYFREHNDVLARKKLLVPLIGAGVASEKYNDFLLFVKMVDLYFENLYADKLAARPIAVPQLVINIQDKSQAKKEKLKKPKVDKKLPRKQRKEKKKENQLRWKEEKKAQKKKAATQERLFPLMEAFAFIDNRFECYEAKSKNIEAQRDIHIEAEARQKRLADYHRKAKK